MTVDVSTIYLLETASSAEVQAELRDAIEEAQIVDWQTQWQPALLEILKELGRRGIPMAQWPQSWHWDWRSKNAQVKNLLAFKGACVICGGVTQGLMRVDLTKLARLPEQKGKPIVYVDYLEVAPWNQPYSGGVAQYKGVGTALMSAAVAFSNQEGFKGRIGLHSLPQADTFYRKRCNMTDLGPDLESQNLRYFEMSPDQARSFLDVED